jgi:hypothetical protein
MDFSSTYSEFAKLAPRYRVSILSEDSGRGGAVINILANDLRINCNWNYMDLSVAVTTAIEADSWTPGWAAVIYLFAYFEKASDPDGAQTIFNSPRQITWLIENFDRVYSLMCGPNQDEQRNSFFAFQHSEFKERSERIARSFKQN